MTSACLVYNAFILTISMHRALVCFTAVAVFLFSFTGFKFVYNCFVVVSYYGFDIAHTAIA